MKPKGNYLVFLLLAPPAYLLAVGLDAMDPGYSVQVFPFGARHLFTGTIWPYFLTGFSIFLFLVYFFVLFIRKRRINHWHLVIQILCTVYPFFLAHHYNPGPMLPRRYFSTGPVPDPMNPWYSYFGALFLAALIFGIGQVVGIFNIANSRAPEETMVS